MEKSQPEKTNWLRDMESWGKDQPKGYTISKGTYSASISPPDNSQDLRNQSGKDSLQLLRSYFQPYWSLMFWLLPLKNTRLFSERFFSPYYLSCCWNELHDWLLWIIFLTRYFWNGKDKKFNSLRRDFFKGKRSKNENTLKTKLKLRARWNLGDTAYSWLS